MPLRDTPGTQISTLPMPRMADVAELCIGEAPADPVDTLAPIRSLTASARAAAAHSVGFPGNQDLAQYGAREYGQLLTVLLNNVHDPDTGDASDIGAKGFEREVIDLYRRLAGGTAGQTYGYVTSGSSEALEFGLFTGRTVLPRATVYASTAAHSSVRKKAEILRMPYVAVPTLPGSDRMDADALARLTATRPGGAVLVVTIGTTMRGDIDDLPVLRAAAVGAGQVFVHADAALGALLCALGSKPRPWGLADGADSVSTSLNKLPGLSLPAGVVLARADAVHSWTPAQYTGADQDHTLSCSRPGLASALAWARLHSLGTDGLRAMVGGSIATADRARERLAALGLDVVLPSAAITVSFTLPGHRDWSGLQSRWRLPVEKRASGTLTHLVTVPHVTTELVDAFTEDIAAVLAGVVR